MTVDDDDELDDFASAGLYDPAGPAADAMYELLEYLVDEVGASIPELVQSVEQGGLLSFAAFRTLRPEGERYTLAELAAETGMSPETVSRLWRCAGFADPRPFERRFSAEDIEMFRTFALLGSLLPEDRALQLVRTIGESVQRVAEAEVAVLRSDVEAPLVQTQSFVDVARLYRGVATDVFPRIADAIDALHRHHLQVIGRRYSDVGAPTTVLNVVQLAVGFADLAGYTGLWQELAHDELAVLISRFEEITGDVIASAGAHVAKRIGDAVMFVTNAPGISCALALDLLEACAAASLPKLRIGLSFGDVMVRHGDFYGPVVNLAARLVAEAEAGTALTDAVLYERLDRVRGGYAFIPAGRLHLAGFFEPVEAYQLLRP